MTYTVTITFYERPTEIIRNVTHIHVEEGVAAITMDDGGHAVVPLAAFSLLTQRPNRTA